MSPVVVPRLARLDRSRWSRVALGAAALLIGSALPVPLERHPEFDTFGPDKLLHLVGHGGFAAVTADALGARVTPGRAVLLAVCLSSGYALLLGRLQVWVPGREPERADLVASVLGSVLGVVGWRYLEEGRDGRRDEVGGESGSTRIEGP